MSRVSRAVTCGPQSRAWKPSPGSRRSTAFGECSVKAHWDVFEELAVALLPLAQRLLRRFSLREIPDKSAEAPHLAHFYG